ncbi:MAG: hypothetical protein N3D77_15010, partial [Geminicoccaceae bacterium]|nr:hypothetical protein [Geminicoccaceae bacterium]
METVRDAQDLAKLERPLDRPVAGSLAIEEGQAEAAAADELGLAHGDRVRLDPLFLEQARDRLEPGLGLGELGVAGELTDPGERHAAQECQPVDERVAGGGEPADVAGLGAIFLVEPVGQPLDLAPGPLVLRVRAPLDRDHALRPELAAGELAALDHEPRRG